MRKLALVFILISTVAFSQSTSEKIQGTWLCVNIIDSVGNPMMGEFGGPRNFLKFQFEADRLFIALAPFDKGSNNRILIQESNFKFINAPFSQQQYEIKALTEESLILKTKTKQNAVAFYEFVNQKKYFKDLDQVSNLRVYEKLIVEMNNVKSALAYYMTSYYLIDNSILNLLPCAQFGDRQNISLGSYLEANIKIPLISMIDLKGKSSVFEFDVTKNGVENIAIVEKLGQEIDFQIYDLIMDMRKKWQPLMVEGKPFDTRIRLKLEFSYQEK